MPLLIPFAAPRAAPWAELSEWRLPNLQSLLSRWVEAGRDEGDELSLSPPHERALAVAQGWHGGDGRLPWAAQSAAADGIDVGGFAWGLLTPCHWHLGTDQVSLIDPAGLMLDEATSRALFAAVQDLFTSQGWRLVWGAPLRWYAAHDSLAELPCASLDRVIGRNIDRWLGHDPGLRLIRRLQSEVQMVLHGHPLNEAREAQGLLPVNSFWLSGCGRAQAVDGGAVQVDDRLRAPALAGDWAGWTRAWETLDDGPIRSLVETPGAAASLTLCGDRASARYEPGPAGLLAGVMHRLRSRPVVALRLEAL